MLYFGEPNRFHFLAENWPAAPANTMTQVTPGASNVWGAWTEIIADTAITSDCYLMEINCFGSLVAGQDKSQLLDIGIDATGGTTYASLLGDTAAEGAAATKGLLVGNANTAWSQGQPNGYVFPLRIPSGAALAVRVQGSNSTAGTVRVGARLYGKPSNPNAIWCGQAIECVGAVTNSGGVTVAAGANADGNWTSLGTTARACRWWQLGYQLSDNDAQGVNYYWTLATGDGSSYTTILKDACIVNTGEQQLWTGMHMARVAAYCPVPAGATMYARCRSTAASPDTTWTAMAVGVA